MTREFEEQLSALTKETLTPIIRRLLKDENAELKDWSFNGQTI